MKFSTTLALIFNCSTEEQDSIYDQNQILTLLFLSIYFLNSCFQMKLKLLSVRNRIILLGWEEEGDENINLFVKCGKYICAFLSNIYFINILYKT